MANTATATARGLPLAGTACHQPRKAAAAVQPPGRNAAQKRGELLKCVDWHAVERCALAGGRPAFAWGRLLRAKPLQNVGMNDTGAKENVTRFLASQDAQTLAQTLLELAEDYPPVYQRLERLRLQSDPTALKA